MRGDEILLLGIGVQAPWQLVDQHLDTQKSPNELHLYVQAEHGVHLVEVPWARKGSAFTLLFEQAAMALVREMPVLAAARLMDITDTRLWRIVEHYVKTAVADFDLSSVQGIGLDEMTHLGLDTATAWRIREKLAWVREAKTPQAARWRIHHFIRWAHMMVGDTPRLEPVRKALETLRVQMDRVVQRWTSNCTNARLEGFNGLFQAARARARGYRNTNTFISMIYPIGSPAGSMLKSI